MRWSKSWRHGIVVLSMLAVGACSSDANFVESGEGSAAGEPDLPVFDPPTKFDADSKVAIEVAEEVPFDKHPAPPAPWALHQTTLYFASELGLQVFDVLTGEAIAEITPSGDPSGVGISRAPIPVLTEVQGTTLVLAAFLVGVSTEGTQRNEAMIELIAVDTATNASVWTATVDLTDYTPDYEFEVNLVGAGETTAILDISGGSTSVGRHETVAVDLSKREVSWRQSDFAAAAVVDDVLVGGAVSATEDVFHSTTTEVTAMALEDGEVRWTLPRRPFSSVEPGGPGTVAVFHEAYYEEGPGSDEVPSLLQFVDVASGEVRKSYEDAWQGGADCVHDGLKTLVCDNQGGTGVSDNGIAAYDVATGEQLWALSDWSEDRVAPIETAVWHGMVYGTTVNGPVVVDARTGEDRETSPGVAPYLVNEYLGLSIDAAGAISGYLAIA